jgi:hypothetical protein
MLMNRTCPASKPTLKPFRSWSFFLCICLLVPKFTAVLASTGELLHLSVSPAAGPAHKPPILELQGPHSRLQLIITAHFTSGQLEDYTRKAVYTLSPEGIAEITPAGVLLPLANGTATLEVVSPEGMALSATIEVKEFDQPRPIHFSNEIVPILTKFGCNAGGCHGKSSGQNGFQLSLLGFEPEDDYEFLVKESRGRRLFPAAPDRSLLLLKASGILPHGGGARIEANSPAYQLLRRWIEQGMPYGLETDPKVVRIEVFPKERSLPIPSEQQLSVTALYSDGSAEDVTHMAQFEPNNKEMVETDETGLIKTRDLAGQAGVMVRFQDHVDVFRATIPLGAPVTNLPPARNFIDELVFKNLQRLGLPISEPADDAAFFRRAAIDIAGRLPSLEETDAFLSDPAPDKKEQWIESLLDSPGYADYFAGKWSAILRNKRRQPAYARGNFAFHSWIRESFYTNKPYSQFVSEILTASGSADRNPAVIWYREVRTTEDQVQDAAQLFLGVRMQCARCHHHPFEKWSQQDYHGFAAYFSQVARKKSSEPGEEMIHHKTGLASTVNPKTKQPVPPTPLASPSSPIPPGDDPRQALADWMTSPENPFFAKMLVNRYWKHFMGSGLVEPEDDMRVTNPPSNPELLEALAAHFITSGFDLKDLVRTISNSRVYQLSSHPNSFNQTDRQNFSRFSPKRLPAEILLDAIDELAGSGTPFPGLPPSIRAVQLPDDSFNAHSYFLTAFGRPEMTTACECERTQDANLAQTLHLVNSPDLHKKLTAPDGRAAQLARDPRPHEEKIRNVYKLAYAREPAPEELIAARQYLQEKIDELDDPEKMSATLQEAYEDIIWAFINTKEFLFNH